MTYTQTAKKVGSGSMENQPLISLLNRNQYLAKQVFDTLDYAKKQDDTQRLCVCGQQIPRDEIIFNKVNLCQSCKGKQSICETPTILTAIQPKGKRVRLSPCHGCAHVFGAARMATEKYCLKCFTTSAPKAIAFLIREVFNNFVNGGMEA